MRVKRYEAGSMQEAILKVRGELGRDAVILHSKKVHQGGPFGLFGRPVYEVIAAVDLPAGAAEERTHREVEAGAERTAALRIPQVGQPSPAATSGIPGAGALAEELAGLRQMIRDLAGRLSPQPSQALSVPGWGEVRARLEEAGLLAEHLQEIEAEVLRQCRWAELGDPAQVAAVVRRYLRDHAPAGPTEAGVPAGKRRVVALVGPTGVGKTTTVAKLAAQHALFGGRRVGLLTVDTYRIAAVEQLKTYAEIIHLPVEVAYSPEEVTQALARLGDREVILVDTAGRSQKNGGQMRDLQAYLQAAQPDEVHLVLSATTRQKDLDDCLAQFKAAGYDRLIFTKLDETDTYGSLYNCARRAGCPVAYLTFGQNVPDDIEEASGERLAELLMGAGEWPR